MKHKTGYERAMPKKEEGKERKNILMPINIHAS